jgi:uncharacterized membrane protein
MRVYTFVGRLLAIVSVAVVFIVPAALAGRVTCRDVDAALKAGKSPAEVGEELGTTATRIEACQRIALDRARHENRRADQRDRHAERALSRD